jgi:urease accessory protein
VKAVASAVLERGAVLRSVVSGPPLTIRRVDSEDADTCRLCLINSAAGPLAGDDITFELTVGEHANAAVVAAGAAIAQGGASRLRSLVRVGEHASLDGGPAPLIVSHSASVVSETCLELAESASVRWRETLVLGRSGEPAGLARVGWTVTRGGRPTLRQSVDLTSEKLASWPGMLATGRVLLSLFISAPGYQATSQVLDPTAVRQRVDGHSVLITVLADDAATAEKRLCALS